MTPNGDQVFKVDLDGLFISWVRPSWISCLLFDWASLRFGYVFLDVMTFREKIYVEVSKEISFITLRCWLFQCNVKINNEAWLVRGFIYKRCPA